MHELIFYTHMTEETQNFGQWIGKHAEEDLFIALTGDLGAGKTHLVQGIAKGISILDNITSPTFSIMNIYDGKLPFKHFDFYRLDRAEELYNIGWDEYSVGGVTVVEWANLFPDLIPEEALCITIQVLSETERKFIITWTDKTPSTLIKELTQYVTSH